MTILSIMMTLYTEIVTAGNVSTYNSEGKWPGVSVGDVKHEHQKPWATAIGIGVGVVAFCGLMCCCCCKIMKNES